MLANGNLDEAEALEITKLEETTLKPKVLPPNEWPIRHSFILPPRSNVTY
jgi:insulysin